MALARGATPSSSRSRPLPSTPPAGVGAGAASAQATRRAPRTRRGRAAPQPLRTREASSGSCDSLLGDPAANLFRRSSFDRLAEIRDGGGGRGRRGTRPSEDDLPIEPDTPMPHGVKLPSPAQPSAGAHARSPIVAQLGVYSERTIFDFAEDDADAALRPASLPCTGRALRMTVPVTERDSPAGAPRGLAGELAAERGEPFGLSQHQLASPSNRLVCSRAASPDIAANTAFASPQPSPLGDGGGWRPSVTLGAAPDRSSAMPSLLARRAARAAVAQAGDSESPESALSLCQALSASPKLPESLQRKHPTGAARWERPLLQAELDSYAAAPLPDVASGAGRQPFVPKLEAPPRPAARAVASRRASRSHDSIDAMLGDMRSADIDAPPSEGGRARPARPGLSITIFKQNDKLTRRASASSTSCTSTATHPRPARAASSCCSPRRPPRRARRGGRRRAAPPRERAVRVHLHALAVSARRPRSWSRPPCAARAGTTASTGGAATRCAPRPRPAIGGRIAGGGASVLTGEARHEAERLERTLVDERAAAAREARRGRRRGESLSPDDPRS